MPSTSGVKVHRCASSRAAWASRRDLRSASAAASSARRRAMGGGAEEEKGLRKGEGAGGDNKVRGRGRKGQVCRRRLLLCET
jgi:hypothetical protein